MITFTLTLILMIVGFAMLGSGYSYAKGRSEGGAVFIATVLNLTVAICAIYLATH